METYHTVYVDTSIDTHMVLNTTPSDTVSHFNDKIVREHKLCFPHVGDVQVNCLKVERKGVFYHLSHNMFLKTAFDDQPPNADWLLSVDIVVRNHLVEERGKNLIPPTVSQPVAKLLAVTSNDDVVNKLDSVSLVNALETKKNKVNEEEDEGLCKTFDHQQIINHQDTSVVVIQAANTMCKAKDKDIEGESSLVASRKLEASIAKEKLDTLLQERKELDEVETMTLQAFKKLKEKPMKRKSGTNNMGEKGMVNTLEATGLSNIVANPKTVREKTRKRKKDKKEALVPSATADQSIEARNIDHLSEKPKGDENIMQVEIDNAIQNVLESLKQTDENPKNIPTTGDEARKKKKVF
ncbi:hypothetical protein ACFE04_009406 [Oxalis oulophora]